MKTTNQAARRVTDHNVFRALEQAEKAAASFRNALDQQREPYDRAARRAQLAATIDRNFGRV